jgi:hypothetical protein
LSLLPCLECPVGGIIGNACCYSVRQMACGSDLVGGEAHAEAR